METTADEAECLHHRLSLKATVSADGSLQTFHL